MSGYDFKTLSPYDFQCLVGDLLHAELGIPFENFAAGPDGGIDLRARQGGQVIIAQCKHYPESSVSTLRSHLKAEVGKAGALAPDRYLLCTSQSLSPSAKQKICSLFSNVGLTSEDVIGRQDLNRLLRDHPAVEEQHYKLYLTTTTVLKKVLKAGLFERSRFDLSQLQRRSARYVQNASYFKAKEILDRERVCVITGPPGIGKSTLAQMLAFDLIRSGFAFFSVSTDMGEADDAFVQDRNQIFLYDDFLGVTSSAEKLNKNEDERIAKFIRKVSGDPTKRLVVTTRDYLLEDALNEYERLSRVPLERRRHVMKFADYGLVDRAKLFYNHLVFSSLSSDRRTLFVPRDRHLPVIEHRNFQPRLIDDLIEEASAWPSSGADFVAQFMQVLDDPHALWGIPFERHLSPEARALVISLLYFPAQVAAEDIELQDQALHGGPESRREFLDRLKRLNNSFVVIGDTAGQKTISFYNPSVRDFAARYAESNPQFTEHFIRSAVFFEPLQRIWQLAMGSGGSAGSQEVAAMVKRKAAAFAQRLLDTIRSRSLHIHRLLHGGTTSAVREDMRLARRLEFALGAMQELAAVDRDRVSNIFMLHDGELLRNKEDAVSLLAYLKVKQFNFGDFQGFFEHSLLRDLAEVETYDDARAVLSLAEELPEMFAGATRDDILDGAGRWIDSELDWVKDDADDPDAAEDSLKTIAALVELGANPPPSFQLDLAKERIDELAARQNFEHSGGGHGSRPTEAEAPASAVDQIFRMLK